MKKVLLISNYVFHYRQKVYNYFYDAFLKDGFEFHVLSDSYQKVDWDNRFIKYQEPFSVPKYCKKIHEIQPDVVIVFLHLKDFIMMPVILYCRHHHIPVIYWNFGINYLRPNMIKNALFHFVHNLCDALITYTPDMRSYFTEKNQDKLFVAYNTIDLSDINKELVPDKEETKKKYGISQKYVVSFISRMLPYKKPELLTSCFADEPDVAVVFVGPGMTEELQQVINRYDNLYYLGEKYGEDVDAIYKMSDVFSTPGHIGLAMNQALFWGLPVVLLEANHSPEIYYMKNGVTGYMVPDEDALKRATMKLLSNEKLRKEISDNCLKVYEREVGIDRMYKGFIDAVRYSLSKD